MPIDLSERDLTEITPTEFARIIRDAGKKDLAAAMTGTDRERVLDEVFARMERQFLPDVGAHLDAVVRWQISGADVEEPSTYELTIRDGRCTSAKGSTGRDARVTITISDVDFLGLVSGNASGPTLFLMRKLRADGDLGLASSLTRYFDIPKQ